MRARSVMLFSLFLRRAGFYVSIQAEMTVRLNAMTPDLYGRDIAVISEAIESALGALAVLRDLFDGENAFSHVRLSVKADLRGDGGRIRQNIPPFNMDGELFNSCPIEKMNPPQRVGDSILAVKPGKHATAHRIEVEELKWDR